MIIGIGADIVSIERIRRLNDRYGARFIEKFYTLEERDQAKERQDPVRYYAKRFAAKEAVLKVLGTGMRAGLSWHDISVVNDRLGAPLVKITGGAAQAIEKKQGNSEQKPIISISLSDEDAYALAFVVIETGE